MHLSRRKRLRPTIPLSSMADIAFLLLIFFIVTSVLKFQEESDVVIPKVPKVETIEQDLREDLWIKKNGNLLIKNQTYSIEDAKIFFIQKMKLVPKTVVFINGDSRCDFKHVEKALKMLTDSGARRVVFVSKQEKEKK